MRTLVEMLKVIEPKLTEARKQTIGKDEWTAASAILMPDVPTRWAAKAFVDLSSLGAFTPVKGGSKKRYNIRYEIIDAILAGNDCNPFALQSYVADSSQLTSEESEILRRHGLSDLKQPAKELKA